MAVDPLDELHLTDPSGICLGSIAIDRIEGHRVIGQFRPAASFVGIRPLFERFENALGDQLFHDVESISHEIERLGLSLKSPDGTECFLIEDLQIINGSELSCIVPNLAIIQVATTTARAS